MIIIPSMFSPPMHFAGGNYEGIKTMHIADFHFEF